MSQDPYPACQYVLWAHRLRLGREPENPQAVEVYPQTTRREIVERFISSPEFLVNQIKSASSTSRRYMVELDIGVRFWLISGDEYVSPAMAIGNYEAIETAFVRRQVRRGMAVLDVGTNLGWFTVQFALLVGSDGRVDAFEPRSDLTDCLNKTIGENRLTNVTMHSYALGSDNSVGQVIWSSHDVNPGGAHLAPPDFAAPGIVAQPVIVKALDSSITHHIDFIKIDVEGSEFLVFEGAKRILSKDRPTILIEINPENLLRISGISALEFSSYIQSLDYCLYEIAPDGGCGRAMRTSELSEIQTFANVAMLPTERAEFVVVS